MKHMYENSDRAWPYVWDRTSCLFWLTSKSKLYILQLSSSDSSVHWATLSQIASGGTHNSLLVHFIHPSSQAKGETKNQEFKFYNSKWLNISWCQMLNIQCRRGCCGTYCLRIAYSRQSRWRRYVPCGVIVHLCAGYDLTYRRQLYYRKDSV